ncbi:MAG TPA: aminopeptidase P family protein [Cyclobacteriaceae bacterium]|nr:aminopeptidase P family protein [Cyclobacteriaceae bacterium]
MRYHPIDPFLFTHNRQKFCEKLLPGSIAVFNANDILPTNADGSLLLKQNSNLFYLSGIDQEETILVLFPGHPEKNLREVLFMRETNEEISVWEGHKLTKTEARDISGIENVMWLNQFETTFNALMAEAEHVYLDSNEHIRRPVTEVETRNARFINACKKKYPLHQYHRSAPVIYAQRAIKSPEEIRLIQQAIDITEKGFLRVLSAVKPGIMEYEIEAEFIHEFTVNRSRGFAYAPIIASGYNACVLHYIENNAACRDGDILLLDVGSEFANYNADLTRSIPVNGKFTKRQKDVYNAVLKVQREAFSMLTPGNIIPEYQKEVARIMESEILGLGLITKTDIKNQDKDRPAYKKYFMHGVSHHLGLDVHDVGSIYRQFAEGMVLTVEPGIYIREESLGIRLEDNVVITKKGIDDLMKKIPIEIGEIEELMNSRP